MSIFATALAALFADPNLAEEAIWHGDLGPVMVRVIRSRPDAIVEFYGQRGVVPTLRISTPASEMTPQEGQTIEIGNDLFRIIGTPRRDALHLVWSFDAVEVAP